jgi:hypothetical protein
MYLGCSSGEKRRSRKRESLRGRGLMSQGEKLRVDQLPGGTACRAYRKVQFGGAGG